MNNRIGIYFAYWTHEWDGDFIYYINKVARLGFDTLEICPANLVDMSKDDCLKIRRAADDAGIDLTYCIGIPKQYDIASADPDVRRAGVEYQKKLIDIINLMGGSIMGGILYSCWPGAYSHGIVSKKDPWDRSVENMKKIASHAEKQGVTLCMEVVNRFEQILLNQAYEAVSYCKEVDSPSCRILLDSFHMNIEEDSFEGAIQTAGKYLAHFHIGETNRRTPGVGKMDWDSICRGINHNGYSGHVVMEPFVTMGGQVGGDIKMWRDLSGGCDENGLDRMAADACAFIRRKISENI